MFASNPVSAVLVSTDLEKGQAFYEGVLGLHLSDRTIKNHLLFDCAGDTSLLIYGRPSGNTANHTQVRFWSNNVAEDVAELIARGVEFEEYATEYISTVAHVATGVGRSAWFKDPTATR